ncbi:sensor histidine kinase [Acuticoccus sp. M5D2P5]|uniref:sensor histidine kinase n=1 Tax=Acuticoccus kalidii TaxID=2910977 RepID=UPI001F1995B9|nr:sensor histidine kinase [Acuticoccus kalidii]MCF3934170.1 sensor histidine kinase [Acuticoccus kalidii]
MDRDALRQLKASVLDAVICATDQTYCICALVLDDEGTPVDYRFLAVGPGFERLLDLPPPAGRTGRDVMPARAAAWLDTCRAVALTGTPARFELDDEATGRSFDVQATKLDRPLHFAIVMRDITAAKATETRMDAALTYQARLLRELNHRVMNSLGMISSIIALEGRRATDPTHHESLTRVKRRVQSVADLYRTLTVDEEVMETRADHFLQKVVDEVASALISTAVRVETDLEPIVVSTTVATPLGLIANELMTNALKYAFAAEDEGIIRVSLRPSGPDAVLEVADNGRGGLDPEAKSGLGQQLVAAFAKQLGGVIDIDSRPGGTHVRVTFSPRPPQSRAVGGNGAHPPAAG